MKTSGRMPGTKIERRVKLEAALAELNPKADSIQYRRWSGVLELAGASAVHFAEHGNDPRARRVGSEKARRELSKFGQHVGKLKLLLDNMSSDAALALGEVHPELGWNIPVGDNPWFMHRFGHLGLRHRVGYLGVAGLLDAALPTLLEAIDEADRLLAANPSSGDRRGDLGAQSVTRSAAHAFHAMTGKIPSRVWNEEEGEETGPFIVFLDQIFKILGIDANSARQARNIIDWIRKERGA